MLTAVSPIDRFLVIPPPPISYEYFVIVNIIRAKLGVPVHISRLVALTTQLLLLTVMLLLLLPLLLLLLMLVSLLFMYLVVERHVTLRATTTSTTATEQHPHRHTRR